jgi:hypothetical protein
MLFSLRCLTQALIVCGETFSIRPVSCTPRSRGSIVSELFIEGFPSSLLSGEERHYIAITLIKSILDNIIVYVLVFVKHK